VLDKYGTQFVFLTQHKLLNTTFAIESENEIHQVINDWSESKRYFLAKWAG